jgi:4-aminobutyrate aminotransferase/(S)-3-amino-2-methylpropionate transaminase
MFASEYLGITPDLTTMAKGIAGGFPLSGLVGKAEIMDSAAPGGLGGTYAGSPLACVAALEVLDIIEEEQLCLRADAIGTQFKESLIALQKEVPEIGDIRQVGAMIAIELNDPESKKPLSQLTKVLVQQAGKAGLILLSCGVKGNVIRFLPPLTIEPELIDQGLKIMTEQLVLLLTRH